MNQPTFHPTDEGFTDAVARSRRRRTRRHAVTASASGTVLAVAAFAVFAGQSATPDSLQQQQLLGPAGAPTAEPVPATTPSDRAGSDQAAGPPPDRSPGNPPPTAAPDGPDAAEPTEEATQPRAGAAPAPRAEADAAISTPARLTTTAYEPNAPCADTTGRAASGWCVQTDPPRSGITGRPVDLALSLCRLPAFGPAAASFPSTAEAGYALDERSGGATLWDHAQQHPSRPGRHDRQVQPGQCLTWTVTWTNRNDQGQPINPGSYELRLSVLADNIGGPNTAVTQTYAYTVENAP